MEAETNDYIEQSNRYSILYNWAICILNEAVFYNRLIDPGYRCDIKDKDVYNTIKTWNPYFKYLTNENNTLFFHYLSELYNEKEQVVFTRKLKMVILVDQWITTRLDNKIVELPTDFVLDQYFFIAEHRSQMEKNILSSGDLSLKLPIEFEANFFDAPFNEKNAIITMVATFLWIYASRKYMDTQLLIPTESRNEVDGAYNFLMMYSAPPTKGVEQKIASGYFIHFYSDRIKEVGTIKRLMRESKIVEQSLLIIDFDKPRNIKVVDIIKPDGILQSPPRLTEYDIDFDVIQSNGYDAAIMKKRKDAIKKRIFEVDLNNNIESIREETHFIQVTKNEAMSYKKPFCMMCRRVATHYEIGEKSRFFCNNVCQEKHYHLTQISSDRLHER